MQNISYTWDTKEISSLFKTVENFKKKNKALLSAFSEFAKISGRKQNSVRNFYYAMLSEFNKDKRLAEKFQVNLSLHKKNQQIFFTEEEVKKSMAEISKLLGKGYSVRKACFEIANGDPKQMLRLQNKFRSETKLKEPSSSRAKNTQAKNNGQTTQKSNLLFMPHKSGTLSDEDINNLFFGLVNLVKRTAKETTEFEVMSQIQSANAELRKSIKDLADKEREIKMLRRRFELVAIEKEKLQEEVANLRSLNVELIQTEQLPEKFNNLKGYINKLGKKTKMTKGTN